MEMLAQALPRAFYSRDPREVARQLLSKLLVRSESGNLLAGRIVEVEAYMGEDDPAAHSAAGRTLRNAVLFGPAGHAYVYFIYGNHYCFNVSCMQEGQAGCVLVRALEPVEGIAEMTARRGMAPSTSLNNISNGPGKLAQALGITRERDNGKDLTSAESSDLWIANDGYSPEDIVTTARVGITKAVALPLRFLIRGNLYVSGPRNGMR
jgi:DNA-3-methyladenine glycosylase